jgi:hypothetical protein
VVCAVVTIGRDPPWKNPPLAPEALTFGGATAVDPPKAGPDGIGTGLVSEYVPKGGRVGIGNGIGSAMIMPFEYFSLLLSHIVVVKP